MPTKIPNSVLQKFLNQILRFFYIMLSKLLLRNLFILIFVLAPLSVSTVNTGKNSQDFVIFHLRDIVIHEDTSFLSSEVYIKVNINNEHEIKTPVVKNVNDDAKINYEWKLCKRDRIGQATIVPRRIHTP